VGAGTLRVSGTLALRRRPRPGLFTNHAASVYHLGGKVNFDEAFMDSATPALFGEPLTCYLPNIITPHAVFAPLCPAFCPARRDAV
jgi:hypothetical protein